MTISFIFSVSSLFCGANLLIFFDIKPSLAKKMSFEVFFSEKCRNFASRKDEKV